MPIDTYFAGDAVQARRYYFSYGMGILTIDTQYYQYFRQMPNSALSRLRSYSEHEAPPVTVALTTRLCRSGAQRSTEVVW